MKICSFLPSGTEILFALGLADSVMGVTFECDYQPEARSKPVVVYSKLPPNLPEREIDRHVKVSDCEFAYGDSRGDESAAHKFEGFLVVGSKKGDTLSLFEMRS
jgi:hypothetical protein